MGRLFQPLLFFLAKCTRHELIRQIEFLHAENQMLRRTSSSTTSISPRTNDNGF